MATTPLALFAFAKRAPKVGASRANLGLKETIPLGLAHAALRRTRRPTCGCQRLWLDTAYGRNGFTGRCRRSSNIHLAHPLDQQDTTRWLGNLMEEAEKLF